MKLEFYNKYLMKKLERIKSGLDYSHYQKKINKNMVNL